MNTLDQPSVTFRPAAFLSGKPGPWAGHLPFACDLIVALKPQIFVQLGVGYGDSYFGFCQAVEENHLTSTCYGVDSWHGNQQCAAAFDAVTRHNDRYYRSFSYLLHTTPDEAIRQFSDQSIGILHLGGARGYEAAARDFKQWFPKVKPGGVVLLDDIALRSADHSVWRLWEEKMQELPNFAFRNSNGLGILWKPGGAADENAYVSELLTSPKENQERIRRYYALCGGNLELEHRLGLARMADAGHSQLQVSISRPGEDSSEDGLTQTVEPGRWVNVVVRLPAGLPGGSVRIDPTNRAAVIDIASLVLRKVGGRTIWSWSPQESAAGFRIEGTAFALPSGESLRLLSFGTAPQLYLPEIPGITADEALELEIRLRVDLQMSAIQEMAGPKGGTPLAAGLEAALEAERKENNAAKAEREKMQAARSLLTQELSIARGNVEDLKAEIENLSTLHSQAASDLLDLRRANTRIAAALEHERLLRATMEQSYSWRAMQPFREFWRHLRPSEKRRNYR